MINSGKVFFSRTLSQALCIGSALKETELEPAGKLTCLLNLKALSASPLLCVLYSQVSDIPGFMKGFVSVTKAASFKNIV